MHIFSQEKGHYYVVTQYPCRHDIVQEAFGNKANVSEWIEVWQTFDKHIRLCS